MICGVFDKRKDHKPRAEHFHKMLGGEPLRTDIDVVLRGRAALASLESEARPTHIQKPNHPGRGGEESCIVWKGEIYNRTELLQSLGFPPNAFQASSSREVFSKLYDAYGLSCVEKINGHFAFAVYDHRRQEIALGRDRLGVERLYYYEDPRLIVFSSRIAQILAYPEVPKELNPDALRRFLIFNYNPAWDTFFRGIKMVRPGSLLIAGHDDATEKRYWFLSFRKTQDKSLQDYCHDIRELTKDSIRLRAQSPDPLGIFLSGGMDSSSVTGLTRELSDRPLWTFSYRCLGRSFDESAYARLMARHCNSEHHEVVYSPADICRMESIVKLMDEPFCDVGINVATFLLGQAAQGKVSRVFSGDGGDELFGGHPVYCADKIAAGFERIPLFLRLPITALLRRLPDSDEKGNFTVKLKRFSESIDYPRELGTHRWRIYYGGHDLDQLLHPDISAHENGFKAAFADLIKLTEEADGSDALSRSLHVDFHTVLGFSLRRMDLLRHFQLTPCFPLLDHRLVEYAATIPSHLKIRGLWDAKYIQRRSMEGVLPDEIVHRKDKLGHSIPFKNWLRSEPVVKQFVQDVISGHGLKERGINSKYVQALWTNHQNRRQNNSHRLWALTVLELWLSANNL